MKFCPVCFIILSLIFNAFFTIGSKGQDNNFNKVSIEQIKNYKSIQLDNGLTLILLQSNDTSACFIRSYSNLPEFVGKNFRIALEIDNELRKQKTFKLPGSWSGSGLLRGKITLAKDLYGFYAEVAPKNLDSAIYLFSDLMQKPVFEPDQFELSKTRIVNRSDSLNRLPQNKVDLITKSIIYGNDHPVMKSYSAAEINQLTTAAYLDFHERFYKPNNSYLLVMGNISLDSLKLLAHKPFSSWKKREVPQAEYKLIPIDEPKIVFFDTILAGNTIIKILFPFALHPFTFDSEKAELLSFLFQDILMEKLGKNLDLASQISAKFESDKITGNYQLEVHLKKDSLSPVIEKIIETIAELKAGKYPEEKLILAKKKTVGNFRKNRTDKPFISWLIINSERNNLPKNYYADFINEIENTDKSGIQTFTAKYLNYNTALFQIPGNWYKSLNDFINLSRDFRIELYNLDGNLEKFIPKGFNGFSVIDNYIQSVGGLSVISKLKEVSISYGAIYEIENHENMFVEGVMVHKTGDGYFSESRVIRPRTDTLFLAREVFDGTFGTDSSMQGKKKLLGDELELLKYKSPFVPEIKYKEWQFKAQLIKADTLQGKHVWVVEIENPAQQKITDYYDVDNGLRYKRFITDKQFLNKRIIQYSQYQKENENGILYPYLKVIFGPQTTIRMKIRDINYDSKLDRKLFEIF
jgi:zinc protease